MSEAILEVAGVSKAFGALQVLGDVDLAVRSGETMGLIGPNGAGKTSLFNVVTGFLSPDRGGVRFRGRDIAGASPEARVRAGLVRTFQKSMVFPALTVRENLALAVRARAGEGLRWWGAGGAIRRADERADALLARAGLTRRAGARVASLSYGEQRMVDILVSLALEPALLLLDEPTAGLAREEADRLLALVADRGPGSAAILIAHDLDIVFGTCDRIAVLCLGRLVAVDAPAAIRRHEGVRAAYLGDLAEEPACA